jgi:Family of unknown function (DUF5675)
MRVAIFFLMLMCSFQAWAAEFAITVFRTSENSNSVTGELYVNQQFISHTLELPWHGNKSYISSIPPGTYNGWLRYDKPLDRWRIQLDNVPMRPGIQIHIGNRPFQIQGCLVVGDKVFNTQNRLEDSAKAYARLKNKFYGTDNPISTPDKSITVTVTYNPARTEFNSPSNV